MESMQYRNEIMNSFSAGDFSIPSYGENQRVLIFFGDPGFDGSDALEYVAGFKRFNDSKDLIICVTNLWKPDEKARMLDSIAKTMNADNVNIISGYGCYKGEEQNCLEKFPAWPVNIFGDPTIENPPLNIASSANYKGFYNSQLDAYQSILSENVFSQSDVVASIKGILEKLDGKYNIEMFVTGPMRDAANVLDDELLSSKVTVIRGVMGGGFGEILNEKRLGYNFAIDPEGTKKFVDLVVQHKIPTVVLSSELCSTIEIKKDDFTKLIDFQNKSPLHQAIASGWENWNKNIQLKKGVDADFNIADLLSSSVLEYPELITKHVRGHYSIYPEKVESEGIHMLSSNARELFDPIIDEDSPMFFIKEVDTSIYDNIMQEIYTILTGDDSCFNDDYGV